MTQPNLEQSLQFIAELACRITSAGGAAIALRNGQDALCQARSGALAPELGARLDAQSGLSGECLRSGEIQQSNDTETDPRVEHSVCRNLGIGSILAIPLRRHADVLGIVEVFSSAPRQFAESDVASLGRLAGLIVELLGLQQLQGNQLLRSADAGPEQLTLALEDPVEDASITALLEVPQVAEPVSEAAPAEPELEPVAVEAVVPSPPDHILGLPAITLKVPRAARPLRLWRALKILVVVLAVLVGGNEALVWRGLHIQRLLHSRYAGFVFATFNLTPTTSTPRSAPDGDEIRRPEPTADVASVPVAPRSPSAEPIQGAPEPAVEAPTDPARSGAIHKLRIVIDPGHGGADIGAVGPGGLKEKDIVLTISKQVGALLTKRLGADVIYTRTDDHNVPLEMRAEMANQAGADLFLSVHANYSSDSSTRGAETYYVEGSASPAGLAIAARENASRKTGSPPKLVIEDQKLRESRKLASEIQQALYHAFAAKGAMNRGVKRAPFLVLLDTDMPSILTEIAFVSSPAEEHNLSTAEGQGAMAEGLYQGIARYLEGRNRDKVLASVGERSGQ